MSPTEAEKEAIALNKILCPYDFSESSSYALKYAVEFASAYKAKLYLLHVFDIRAYDYGEPVYGISVPTKDAINTIRTELANSIPEKVKKELSASGGLEAIVASGVPFYEIIKFANDNKIDLIVMGTHGRTGLAHILLGSVAEKVVRKASCPVLTVRHPGQEFVKI
ncbi:MAG TPA: universal stress protein [Candidatus Brocadiia bacterium]|nr:universal stress protein [Planctomycetota bacterium]MDO8093098.1 universal stress protein [Candidatus Brocadiales bacterium]